MGNEKDTTQEPISGIPLWPDTCAVEMKLRGALHPLFSALSEGISEFTFANIFLFRRAHAYGLRGLRGRLS